MQAIADTGLLKALLDRGDFSVYRKHGSQTVPCTTICESFVFLRKFSNAEARRTQSFAEFNFLCGSRRPLHLCVKVSRRMVAAPPRQVFPVKTSPSRP